MSNDEFITPLIPGLFQYELEDIPVLLPFQFNPEELTRSRSATVDYAARQKYKPSEKDGTGITNSTSLKTSSSSKKKADPYTVNVSPWNVNFKIRLDSSIPPLWQARSIVDSGSEEILMLMLYLLEKTIEPGTPKKENEPTFGFATFVKPPPVTFFWGWRVWKGFITSLNVSETKFRFDLLPMRAEVSIGMEVLEATNLVSTLAAGLSLGLSVDFSGGFSL